MTSFEKDPAKPASIRGGLGHLGEKIVTHTFHPSSPRIDLRYLLNAGRVAGALAGGAVAFTLAAVLEYGLMNVFDVPERLAAVSWGGPVHFFGSVVSSVVDFDLRLGAHIASLWSDRSAIAGVLVSDLASLGHGVLAVYMNIGESLHPVFNAAAVWMSGMF